MKEIYKMLWGVAGGGAIPERARIDLKRKKYEGKEFGG
jgi:hypothetical protein